MVTFAKRSGNQKILFATSSRHHTENTALMHKQKELEMATFGAQAK